MPAIHSIRAREILDSRGRPTVEVEITCRGGAVGRAAVPSGASRGRGEAVELRDGDTGRYGGLGVLRAVDNVNGPIAAALAGHDAADQGSLDRRLIELDGTPNKSRLGANALLGVSLAAAHAAAADTGRPLYAHLHELVVGLVLEGTDPPASFRSRMPVPMTNMISGGLHAGGDLEFQDFLILPVGAASYGEGLEWIVRVHDRLGDMLRRQGFEGRLVADEGGYGPRLGSHEEALRLLVRAVEEAELIPSRQVTLALDVAATHFHRQGRYHLRGEGGAPQSLDARQMVDHLQRLAAAFPIASIEDGLAEEDWAGWEQLTARLGPRLRIVGDDLLATHPDRIREAIRRRAANAALIKLNQVGTLSETIAAMRLARRAGMALIVSARSGETEDTTIADLAVAAAVEHIKIGSVTRSERLAKYNRLTRIAEELAVVD